MLLRTYWFNLPNHFQSGTWSLSGRLRRGGGGDLRDYVSNQTEENTLNKMYVVGSDKK